MGQVTQLFTPLSTYGMSYVNHHLYCIGYTACILLTNAKSNANYDDRTICTICTIISVIQEVNYAVIPAALSHSFNFTATITFVYIFIWILCRLTRLWVGGLWVVWSSPPFQIVLITSKVMATVLKGGEVGVVQGFRVPGMSNQCVIERGAMSRGLHCKWTAVCVCVKHKCPTQCSCVGLPSLCTEGSAVHPAGITGFQSTLPGAEWGTFSYRERWPFRLWTLHIEMVTTGSLHNDGSNNNINMCT